MGIRISVLDAQRIVARPLHRLGSTAFAAYLVACKEARAWYEKGEKAQVAPLDNLSRLVSAFERANLRYEVDPVLKGHAQAPPAPTVFDSARLFPFQRTGVEILAGKLRWGLFDEPGLGKTIQALAALPAHSPVLVVAPAVVKGVWRQEARAWRPEYLVTVLSGTNSFRWPMRGEIVVTNYDILPATPGTPLADTVVIADEAHAVKTAAARRTKRFRAISHLARVYRGRVWLLTGTPLMNRPVELWHVLEAADLANEAFGSWPRYCQMFGAVKKSIYTGHGKREVLDWGPPSAEVARCLRSVSLRRHRLDVLPDLPTKIHQDHIVDEIPAETREQCDELVRKLERQGIDLTDATATIELARIEDAAFDMLSRIRAALATAKLPALIRLVETFEESEEPVVVFSAHRKPIDTLGARPGWAAITGDVGHERRTEIVADFQAGKLKGLALTIAAGGVGLTLTHAHQALFCDLAWTPAANAQAEDRICVLEGQLIHTRAGMTPVEAVKVGDLVLNKEGNWTPVTAVSSRQHLGLVTDIGYTRYTTPLRLTHDHLVLVLRREEPSPQWVPAFSILPGDFLLMPRPLPGPRLTSLDVPEEDRPPNESTNQFGFKQRQGRRRQLPPSVTLDEDLLFTFGFYLAEGFASIRPNKGRFISFSAHSEERPILERIANRLTTLGGVRCSIYTASANGIEMRAFSADLARWFFGLFGHGARHKSIPPVLMDLPADQARHLLEGYLVGDGYDRRRQRSWVSVSLALSHQIALLALRCGYSPALNERKEPAGAWVGTFTVDGDPDNPGLVKADESFVYQPVRTVTTYNASRHPRPVVYDLEVPDGESFVVGMATVHNCRIGQDRGVIVTRLIADHLVDRKVTELLARKQELIEATVEASAVGGGR